LTDSHIDKEQEMMTMASTHVLQGQLQTISARFKLLTVQLGKPHFFAPANQGQGYNGE